VPKLRRVNTYFSFRSNRDAAVQAQFIDSQVPGKPQTIQGNFATYSQNLSLVFARASPLPSYKAGRFGSCCKSTSATSKSKAAEILQAAIDVTIAQPPSKIIFQNFP
jgi:hypothetical protein